MAEGLTNALYPNRWEAHSAGTEKTFVKSLAIEAMSDMGVDITHHSSKLLEEFLDKDLDLVVTVCDDAKETCPWFPHAAKQIHAGFEDPSNAEGTYEDRLATFIKTREIIKAWLAEELPKHE